MDAQPPSLDSSGFEALSAKLGQAAESPEPVCRVLYQSRSFMSGSDHASLLVQCHKNNRRLGLTGLLMIQGDRIVQVLEGPEAALTQVLDNIRADARHSDFQLLERQQGVPRLFPDWGMGSVALSARGLSVLIEEIEAASDEERRRLAGLIRDGRSLARG